MLHYNKIAGQRVQRIEALSDGVFAIAITILVFNLKDPIAQVTSEKILWRSLKEVLPTLLACFPGFVTLGIFWTGQSTQFNFIEKYDRNLNRISILFLFFVSLVPFSISLPGNHINNKITIGIYWLNILALGAMLYVHWRYARKKNFLSFTGQDQKEVNTAIVKRIIAGQSMYFAGALLCFINTYLSIFVIIAIQMNYAFGIFAHQKKKHSK
ncbi:MAG: TMEM175 family protein [Chitinophagaceae bacterium]|nr:TMEM175 family protein [Chitinophagaceae bacterium]